MPSRVTHFEIYGADPSGLADFYRSVFGWETVRAEGVDYWRIHFEPTPNCKADGGLLHRPSWLPRGWLQYVSVEDLDATIATAEGQGAKVIRPKTAVPRTAWYAVLSDPEGNVFAVWQPDAKAMPPPEPD